MTARVYYLRDPQTISSTSRGIPVACLVSHYDATTKMVSFALATGSPTLSFEKKLFRTMAEVRLSKRSLSLTFDQEPNGHEISRCIMSALVAASDACLKSRRVKHSKKTQSGAGSFASFLKKEVASGKKLNDVLDQIETKSHSDWRDSISQRTGAAAKAWLAMADLPKAPNTSPDLSSPFSTAEVGVQTSTCNREDPISIREKVETFIANAKT